jgi:hypothetical protein
MTLAMATEAEVRMELWLSFISVLRSYAFLSSLESEPAVMSNLDDNPCSIIWSTVCDEGRRRCGLTVSYDAQKAQGTWRVSADNEPFRVTMQTYERLRDSFQPFILNLDGTVSLDSSNLDMDHAAMEMLGYFANAVKSGHIEVPA